MRRYKSIVCLFVVVVLGSLFESCQNPSKGELAVKSFDTGYTISKVRTAKAGSESLVVASSFEGTLLAIDLKGKILWSNPLSGYMNHDLWCADITGDGNDEVLAANADGTLYCLNFKGDLLWKFKKNSAPLYSVCVLRDQNTRYVVCGGFDKSIYYLSGEGKELKEVSSYGYSQEMPMQPYSKAVPDSNCHLANFIRPVKQGDGKEVLAVQGVIHSMAIGARGSVYLFKPLEDQPYKTIKLLSGRPMGEFRLADTNQDGDEEILMGSSTMINDAVVLHLDIDDEEQKEFSIQKLQNKIDRFGYRVVQPELVTEGGDLKYFVLFGSRVLLLPLDFKENNAEVLACKYAFNDMWNDRDNHLIVLASIQSGGSCIYLVDLNNAQWKQQYQNLKVKGKIADVLKNSADLRSRLKEFQAPEWEKKPRAVYLMSESRPESVQPLIADIRKNYPSPIFLNSAHTGRAENYDRSKINNERYRNRRDRRRTYDATSQEIVDFFSSKYEDAPGLAFWGGHGNDPYMFRRGSLEKILDHANGKKTVLIFPELEDHSDNFAYVMDDYFYPLARYCQKSNGQIYVRTKHTFWQSTIYMPMWSRLLSGEFSDVFVPAMEETTDKSMELSVVARLGIWASGAVDSWGSRCARDNASFDRLRQHSHQMVPNHFLRNMVYHVSLGAQYLDNFTVDQDYMSLLWELVAKGALYVPERQEIVSLSPVHLSMFNPDDHYADRSSNVKWTTFYDQQFEDENSFVFSRLSGSWPGAPVTPWDFSRYAAGVSERRLNFLPPYPNGMVLITPPQNGIYADKDAPRGALTAHLNPIYKNIMKEFYTNGRDYFSADGKRKFSARTYYKTVEEEIKSRAALLPLSVSGDLVAWVAAQSSPTHLRLTLIDGGYVNPHERRAEVSFNTIHPVKMVDLLSGESFDVSGNSASIDIPCGMFRFIDIELSEPLTPVNN